ncbi:MAG: patatin-like phospholipase family protein [Alcanivoracaceae bacterium]|nr:patatin-like phospholipase family protein [Alcanivoracaceae bacterium]
MLQPKRALVLGCGGVAGAAWQIATLEALQKQLNWDARSADILIGTSAGSVLAALLSAGVSVERMVASEKNTAADCFWNHDTDTGGAFPPVPKGQFTAMPLLWKGIKGEVSPITAIAGLLPRGNMNMQPFMDLIDSVVPAGQWTKHKATWIVVVDAATGERVVLGRDYAADIPLNRAVCASYAVPSWCPPVSWAGREFLDGGIASPASADMLIGTDIEEAIVLTPMAAASMDNPRSRLEKIERRVRRYMTNVVNREIAQLERAGIRVIRLEPTAEDLGAFGFNMMDPHRRERVFATACSTAPAAVANAISKSLQSAERPEGAQLSLS